MVLAPDYMSSGNRQKSNCRFGGARQAILSRQQEKKRFEQQRKSGETRGGGGWNQNRVKGEKWREITTDEKKSSRQQFAKYLEFTI